MNNKKINQQKKNQIPRFFIVSIFIIVILLVVIPLTTIYILTKAYDDQIRNETTKTSAFIRKTVRSFVDGAYNLSSELATNPAILTMKNDILSPILADCVNRNDYMVLLYITGMDGMQIARSSGQLGDRSGRFWFKQMKVTGQPFVSPSYYSLTGNMPCTSIFLPMCQSNSDEMIGIFGADIDLIYLQQLAEQFANPESGLHSFIIDGEGVVIAHPDYRYLETLTNYKTLIRTVSVMDEHGNALLNPDTSVVTMEEEFTVSDSFSKMITSVMSGNSGLDVVEYNGTSYYMSYEPINLPGYSDSWSVVTMQNRSIAMSAVSRLIIQVTIIVAAIIIIFTALIYTLFKTLRKTMTHLETANDRFKIMFDSNPYINILFNSRFEVIDCNSVALNFMGFESKEQISAGFAQRVARSLPKVQSDGRITTSLIERLTAAVEKGVEKFETELHFEDRKRIVDVEFKKISYDDSFAIIANAHDITDIRRRELELKKARMDAEIASQSKSNFLANMSHEMRTPMNAIIGMTAIGRKSKSIVDKNHSLNKIGDASSHLLGVINDVLDMAKIEADKLELSPIEYSFERVLQKVLTVVNFRVEEKEQQLTVNVDKNIPRFLIGDEQRLVQIITNLMSNAVKFTPEGGHISLNAFLVSENEGNCELRIEVTDSGIGISAEQKERLFLAFEQADAGTSRQYGGTGLGLTISKRIIELMGGKIWVESDLGKGAKFIFTVKARRSNNANENLGLFDKDKEDNIIGGEFTGKNLLVVEDVEINREILISLLHDTGLSIDCAENGKEALKMVEANTDKYDIVFMDVQMPVMNGHEATRRIRAFEASQYKKDKRIPIIALTANVFKSDIEDCLAAGMNDHLGKPLDIDRVIEKLRQWCQTPSNGAHGGDRHQRK
ncbi:MAG: ATP-binding protein [Treponema sp.]|nr:ATP-binding protein [Treponema sp.]